MQYATQLVRLSRPRRVAIVGVAATIAIACGFLAARAQAAAVSCGQVITKKTKLNADLTGCPGDGVVVGADDIVLNLNGHTISGVGGEGRAGVRVDGHDGVTVTGPGVVEQFEHGVELGRNGEPADDNVVSRVTLQDNFVGLWIEAGSNNTASRNTARSNDGGGLFALFSDHNTIRDNHSEHNTGGIGLTGGSSNTVSGNIVRGNSDTGILLNFGTTQNVIERNRLDANRDSILLLFGSDHNTIERNKITDVPGLIGEGIAILLYNASSNHVQHNTAANPAVSGGDGISLQNSSTHNDVVANAVRKHALNGIHVDNGSSDNTIERNVPNNNGADGLFVEDSNAVITRNGARNNGGHGIEAKLGVTDGGRNVAARNQTPPQCINVICRPK